MEEIFAHKECEVCEVCAEVEAVRVSDGEAVARWCDGLTMDTRGRRTFQVLQRKVRSVATRMQQT